MNKRYIRYIVIIISMLMISVNVTGYADCHAQARTVVTNPPYYDQTKGCYVQVTTETYTVYDDKLKLNRNVRKTTTICYTYDNNNYVLISENVNEETVSYEQPDYTSAPQTTMQPTPVYTVRPSATPVPTATATPYVPYEPMDIEAPELRGTRKSGSKARISWDAIDNADGYIVYRSTKENSGYSKVKKIKNGRSNSYNDSKLKSSKTYYYKVKAYQKAEDGNNYTDMSEPYQITTVAVKKTVARLKKLKEQFPNGMYWNHSGYKISKGQAVEGFVTSHPCVHNGTLVVKGRTLRNISSACNYYRYTVDGKAVMGYQCAGYAAMLNDKLFGKGGFRSHNSYSNAKVGDIVRYLNQHSAVIIEKHADYVIVTECNYGNTCKIKWGRKISRSNLNNALYYTKK